MPDMIRDGIGKGYLARVDSNKRLWVSAENESVQHTVSLHNEEAYQCIGVATLAVGTATGLHIKNTSSDKNMVVTYIRYQIVDSAGGTVFPNVSNYYSIALGRTYSSGGSTATPVNVFSGSKNSASVIAYQGAPVLAGTANEIDRWYTKAEGDMNTFNKEGAVIVGTNKTIELSYVGDQTSGILYTRMSFLMKKNV